MAYATVAELRARVSAPYVSHPDIAADADAQKLLDKASELIDFETMNRASLVDVTDTDALAALSKAACDQVEFWLEVGESHDVVGLTGSLVAGRVQVHPVAKRLGPRARRALQSIGLGWLGVGAR